MSFTHLHVHTGYSLLDGSGKIPEMVKCAVELGMDSMAITDHGVMYGVIDFYRACLSAGIKPILGCEVYVAPGSRFDKENNVNDERYHHLVLLAENNTGYSNLIKIVSKGFTDGFYYKPRVDYEVLEKYHEGIIALSACLQGEVAIYLRRGMHEEAKKSALHLQEIFGENNFFLELQDHGIPEQKMVNQGILRISRDTGIKLVATNDIHYTYEDDAEAHDILLCIQTQKKVNDEDRMRYTGGQYYIKSEEEMRALFPYAEQAIENTHDIAERCNVEIVFGEYKLPRYDVPEPYTAWEYLNKLCNEGLREHYDENDSTFGSLIERLDYELNTIKSMGFVDYFLIVWDFIKYARDNGISVGPGRGSAAGSIVSYSLGITNIDPIKYNLLFERFLNPERVTMPDIDIDFCFERRQEVIDYVVRKYGRDRVVQIVTFGTMAARAVIRDVGRAMDLPYARVDTVAKLIPFDIGITIEKALAANPDLRNLYAEDEEVRTLINMSKKLEGLPRHASMHAAGVVISNAPAEEYVPLSRAADGTITTQFTMTTLEELGLLKMDFLGLRTLTVIQNAVRLINDTHPCVIKNIYDIDYDDSKVYEMISAGKTEGVFQLESTGMTNFMKDLKPENLEDIIAGISLYRPGPMDFIPKYIKGKHDPDSIIYDCEELRPILENTYGCIVYQEQVMQIVRKLAGYSFGRSDLVRRAMSKKKASVMEKERQNFVYGNEEEGVLGCKALGISETVANKIYDDMSDFAKYAFNKSHAAAYAVVAYQTAYLKYYYPVEFMAALLTSIIDNPGKVAEYIYTCRQMGIKILPPDINTGEAYFTVVGDNIGYALSAIKGIGRPVVEAVSEERKQRGAFTDLKNFGERLTGKEVNKRTLENLIKAGAFDSMKLNRKQKMLIYAQVLDSIAQERKNMMSGQMSLFDFDDGMQGVQEYKAPDVPEYTKDELLTFEKEVLGIYVSGHPLEAYESLLKKATNVRTTDFLPDEESGEPIVEDKQTVYIGGIVADRTLKTTKSNTVMAFITLEDLFGTVEVIVFPRDYETFKLNLDYDSRVLIKGSAAVEEERAAKIILKDCIMLDNVPRELWIRFKDVEDYKQQEAKLMQIIGPYEGNNTVCIYCKAEKLQKRLPANRNIAINSILLDELYKVFGNENVAIKEKSIENIWNKG